MSLKTKVLLNLLALSILDLAIPIPILGIALIYIVVNRPTWFKEYVLTIYNSDS